MVRYRRNRVPGGTYFFTATLYDRRCTYLVDHIHALRTAFATVLAQRPFTIKGIVILPDHLHTIWTLPPGDSDYAGRWRAIKSGFSRSLVCEGVHVAKNRRGEYALWQPRYWEHTIRDDRDFHDHLAYIHFNPVKHGWVARVADWPYSSFHRYVCAGVYPPDWGDGGV